MHMKKVRTSITISGDLVEKAREYNVNISSFLDIELRKYIAFIEGKAKQNYFEAPFIKGSNIDTILTGIKPGQTERIKILMDIINMLCDDSQDGLALDNDILREAEIKGLDSDKAKELLDRLKYNGLLYSPARNKYKITEY